MHAVLAVEVVELCEEMTYFCSGELDGSKEMCGKREVQKVGCHVFVLVDCYYPTTVSEKNM